jgi:hypothetical protein
MNRGVFGTNNYDLKERPPFFQGTSAAAQTGVSNATVTQTQLSSTYDTHIWWDSVNFVYRPKIAGYYRLNAQVQSQAATSINYSQLFFRKNSVTLVTAVSASGLTGTVISHASASFVTTANGSTDYLDLACLISGTGALQFNAGATLQIEYWRAL